jgi:hypothetical protein
MVFQNQPAAHRTVVNLFYTEVRQSRRAASFRSNTLVNNITVVSHQEKMLGAQRQQTSIMIRRKLIVQKHIRMVVEVRR